jgi:4-diphosphocytidyl-2-C-methyl-D-erythritol kinase
LARFRDYRANDRRAGPYRAGKPIDRSHYSLHESPAPGLTGFDKPSYIGIITPSMAASVRVRAPAKVNLHLRVYGRRPDGFHGILSLFQALSLSDEVVVRSLTEPDAVRVDGAFDCPPERTTLYKAAIAFREATGIRDGLAISVDKRVPAGAGLGGGSSDAAALLRALDALFETGLPLAELERLGASVGSDVPFFLSCGAALVSGRGEEVEPIAPREDLAFLVAFPGFPAGTAWAYSLLDRERPDDSGEADPSGEEIEAAYRGAPSLWPYANSFEPCVGREKPGIPALRRAILEAGASFAAMTGSGSSVFGAFEDIEAAERARSRLAAKGMPAYAAVPLARPPALD